jgi:hypothetical protein
MNLESVKGRVRPLGEFTLLDRGTLGVDLAYTRVDLSASVGPGSYGYGQSWHEIGHLVIGAISRFWVPTVQELRTHVETT